MREGGQRTGSVGRATWLLVCAGTLLLPACAGLIRSYDYAPSGLTRVEEGFRQRLVQGTADSLFVQELLHGETAPGDELLRGLYGGVAAYYAGRYTEAGILLDRAALLSEERVTKSISRSALSLISNDRALPYEPPRTERLLIHYYAALAYLQQHDRTGALVEVRRLSALLEQYEHDLTADEAALHGALRVFAGATFQAAGERNDAAVAYRQAGGFADVDSVLRMPPRDSADIIVLIEDGFVAHRVEEGLSVLLAPEELHALREGDDANRLGIASLISGRVVASAGDMSLRTQRPRRGPLVVGAPTRPVVARHDHAECRADDAPSITDLVRPARDSATGKPTRDSVTVKTVKSDGTTVTRTTRTTTVTTTGGRVTATPAASNADRRDCPDDDDTPYLLRVAWPSYRWSSRPPLAAPVLGSRGDTLATATFADLSSAVLQDFRRELPMVVARTLVRGAAKAALTRIAEDKLDEKNEGLGELAGVLGNIGNVLLERADTRSWHLLPNALGVARVRVPAGEHELRVQLPDGRVLALGALTVKSRETRVVSARSW